MENYYSFKSKTYNKLLISAKKYYTLLDKQIILISNKFEKQKIYKIRFYKDNFLHLTGVKTSLSAEDFFDRCFNKTISLCDFDCESTSMLKGLVRKKIRNLVNIDTFFDNKIYVEENFSKSSIRCALASTNNVFTIGFADAKYHLRPQTLLDKNCLNKNKEIITVKPIIKKI